MKKMVELKLNKMFWIEKYKCLGQCIKVNEDQGVFILQKPLKSVCLNKQEVIEYEEVYRK